jgi:hypothetical protein
LNILSDKLQNLSDKLQNLSDKLQNQSDKLNILTDKIQPIVDFVLPAVIEMVGERNNLWAEMGSQRKSSITTSNSYNNDTR